MEITVNVTNDGLTIDVKIEGSGPPGKTPVKGVDYWTDADKREIIDEVLEEIPGGGGGGSGNVFSLDISTIAVLDLSEYESMSEKDAETLYLIRG